MKGTASKLSPLPVSDATYSEPSICAVSISTAANGATIVPWETQTKTHTPCPHTKKRGAHTFTAILDTVRLVAL